MDIYTSDLVNYEKGVGSCDMQLRGNYLWVIKNR